MSSAVQLTITRFSTFSQINEICGGELFATRKKQLFLDNESDTLILRRSQLPRCQAVPLFASNRKYMFWLVAGSRYGTAYTTLAECGYHSYKHKRRGGREGGRRKLVYSCGEIGLYPPRRWAQHTCVVDLHIWYSSDWKFQWNAGNCSWWVTIAAGL